MQPYRTSPPDDPLPRLPMRSVVPQVATLAVVATLAIGAVAVPSRSHAPPPSPPETIDAGPLIQLFRDDDPSAAHLADTTVIIRSVFRDFRHDSFGHAYFELGTRVNYEVPIIQCFLAGGQGTPPPSGSLVRIRARLIGISLGVALQADECVLGGAVTP